MGRTRQVKVAWRDSSREGRPAGRELVRSSFGNLSVDEKGGCHLKRVMRTIRKWNSYLLIDDQGAGHEHGKDPGSEVREADGAIELT